MNKKILELGKYYDLPRGGYIVNTSEGYIQVGSPPETIKDTMGMEKGVPNIICLPKIFFDRKKAISLAELEFPIYFNYFIQRKKTTIICLHKHEKIFKKVITEALYGPGNYDISNDYPSEETDLPNIKKETLHFATFKFNDLVEFKSLNEEKKVQIGKCSIYLNDESKYEIEDETYNFKVIVPSELKYKVIYDVGSIPSQPFKPPLFGMTCLGSSHGFDPNGNTSGFIVWINGMGIMVDPPVNSTEWLLRSNVNPKLIDSIILTHTHADHDTGTFQKILEENRITIYTTKTIMDSWLRKYSTLAEIDIKQMSQLFDFIPVIIGRNINIKGAWFKFKYMLHSIPTMGFRFYYRDRSFVYSSDHLNDKAKFKELLDKKVISRKRYEEFVNFPWDADVIYHESGVPPLHTPIGNLNALDEEIQKKIFVYHISDADFYKGTKEKGTSLTLSSFGIANTKVIDFERSSFQEAYAVMDIITKIDLFKDFTPDRVRDLLAVIRKENYPKGTHVIKKGERGDTFFIILSGCLVVRGKDSENSKRFSAFQYLGEVSLLTKTTRSADVYAENDVELLTISRTAFVNLISGTKVEEKLLKIANNRDELSWDVLSKTSLFENLTSSQKVELEILLDKVTIGSEEVELLTKGKHFEDLYIYHSGEVKIMEDGGVTLCQKGDFIGNYNEFNNYLPSSITCTAKDAILFKLEKNTFKKYINDNPGVYLRFFESLA